MVKQISILLVAIFRRLRRNHGAIDNGDNNRQPLPIGGDSEAPGVQHPRAHKRGEHWRTLPSLPIETSQSSNQGTTSNTTLTKYLKTTDPLHRRHSTSTQQAKKKKR